MPVASLRAMGIWGRLIRFLGVHLEGRPIKVKLGGTEHRFASGKRVEPPFVKRSNGMGGILHFTRPPFVTMPVCGGPGCLTGHFRAVSNPHWTASVMNLQVWASQLPLTSFGSLFSRV